ncbi:Tfp pilus assembly protein PilX [Allochromatium warmingii]|uniref:Tfp pilus assembly protein PilX n=1 Tax=Allochromatium warmingii TaxID=61595 RepID=A0A1H3DEW7_ALLWA|nr:PilX N-terminal domain-containing pilus assembly protein [Allochromatium warmingii]SDX64880.1 Tfp pilus assembly protein PilX [Allochromatium warmingii]
MIRRSNIRHLKSSLASLEIKSQSGVALIISLLFLIIISLVSIAGLQGVALQETMTSGTYDRNIAFQMSEAALRFAEERAKSLTPPSSSPALPDDNCPTSSINACTNGLCEAPDFDCMPRWTLPEFEEDNWVDITSSELGNLGDLANTTPQYFIEYLGQPSEIKQSKTQQYNIYRITVRNKSPNEENTEQRSTVMLQSVYSVPE